MSVTSQLCCPSGWSLVHFAAGLNGETIGLGSYVDRVYNGYQDNAGKVKTPRVILTTSPAECCWSIKMYVLVPCVQYMQRSGKSYLHHCLTFNICVSRSQNNHTMGHELSSFVRHLTFVFTGVEISVMWDMSKNWDSVGS